MEYSVIVFDTAPTGHTLRFLSFPSVLEKALGKISSLSGRFGPMLQQVSAMMGGPGAGQQEDMFAKLDGMRAIITEVNQQFKDPVRILLPCFIKTVELKREYFAGCRKRLLLSACAFLNSYRYTRPSVLFKSLRPTELIRIIS